MSAGLNRPLVIMIGPFPPPAHGAANVTAAMADRLGTPDIRLVLIDTGPASSRTVPYHLRRIIAHAHAVRTLISKRGTPRRSVYLSGAGGHGIIYQSIVVTAARLLGYRIAYHHHSFAYLDHRALAMRILVALGGASVLHITLCDVMSERMASCYSRALRTLVISNTAVAVRDTTPPPARQVASPQRPVVLCHLSNLSMAKGLGRVLATLDYCLLENLNVVLHLAGPASGEEERSAISDAQERVGGRIQYVGALKADSVDDFVDQGDLFLFPSLYRNEAEPLVVAEAMARGLPTLAYQIGCATSTAAPSLPPVSPSATFPKVVAKVVEQMLIPGEAEKHRYEARQRFEYLRRESLNACEELTAWLTWRLT